MIQGYLCLGGGQEELFPQFAYYKGEPVGPNRGRWGLNAPELREQILSIPSRDKQVQLLYNNSLAVFSAGLAKIDSENAGGRYRDKLKALLPSMDLDFAGVVNNKTNSSHKSLAIIVSSDVELYLTGLFDTRMGCGYLVWADDPVVVSDVLAREPLRYYLYRFPVVSYDVLFFPIETLCSQWHRWIRGGNLLQAFNALERRLFGLNAEV